MVSMAKQVPEKKVRLLCGDFLKICLKISLEILIWLVTTHRREC